MSRLDGVLNEIQQLCLSHGLQYRLEKIIGEDRGARIRVVYVRPENKLQYMNESLGMHRKSGLPDPVEAEALVTITSRGERFKGSFEITKNDGTKVLDDIKPMLEEVVRQTSEENAHKVIPDTRWVEPVRCGTRTPARQT